MEFEMTTKRQSFFRKNPLKTIYRRTFDHVYDEKQKESEMYRIISWHICVIHFYALLLEMINTSLFDTNWMWQKKKCINCVSICRDLKMKKSSSFLYYYFYYFNEKSFSTKDVFLYMSAILKLNFTHRTFKYYFLSTAIREKTPTTTTTNKMKEKR